MFKAQVLRRSFSAFNRVPTSRIVQAAARDGHESVTIHRIRIRRPFFSRQRLVGAVAVATATYGLAHYLGLEVEIEEEEVHEGRKPGRWKKQARKEDGTLEEVDDEEANGDEDENDDDDDDEEYDDVILFLPTGLSRRKPMKYYKGSDPEWQEFKKVSHDKARIGRIQQELVNYIRAACSTPAWVAKIGEVNHKKGRAWIEIRFPDAPPPEYERPGYELTEDLEWRKSSRDVEPVHHYKLNKVLYPTVTAGVLYKDTKRKAERTWNDFAVYMGWAEKTKAPTVQQMVQQIGTTSPPASPAAPPATAAPASPFGASLPGATQQPAGQSSPPATSPSKDLGIALPDAKALTLDLGQFRQEFHKASHKAAQFNDVPRGTFGVLGLVEVYGSKARVTMNVVGVYDPKAGRYVGVHANIWNQVANRQVPKG